MATSQQELQRVAIRAQRRPSSHESTTMHFDYQVVIDQFRLALKLRGAAVPETIKADGKIHRCDAEGRKGKGGVAYKLYMKGIPAGGFNNWHDGKGWENWRADVEDTRTPQEKARFAAEIAEKKKRSAEETRQNQAEAKRRADWIWYHSEAETPDHPYL